MRGLRPFSMPSRPQVKKIDKQADQRRGQQQGFDQDQQDQDDQQDADDELGMEKKTVVSPGPFPEIRPDIEFL